MKFRDYCPGCHVTALASRDGEYCPSCGTKLVGQPRKRICDCGQAANPRDEYCIACGKPLKPGRIEK